MNAASIHIKDILSSPEAGELGLVFGTTLFIGREPAKPDNCATIYDYAGKPPALAVDGTVGYEYPAVQIRVRNLSYFEGMNLVYKIQRYLHGMANKTIEGTLYGAIYCSSGPAFLDWDNNNRVRLIINYQIQRR